MRTWPQEAPEILLTGVKEKLANLQNYMPGEEQIIYDFANFLSERANDKLVPMGFEMLVQLALYDLWTWIDGFTNKPIRSSLVGYPPMMYQLLNMRAPQIAEAIFGKECSDIIENIRWQVLEKLSKSTT